MCVHGKGLKITTERESVPSGDTKQDFSSKMAGGDLRRMIDMNVTCDDDKRY